MNSICHRFAKVVKINVLAILLSILLTGCYGSTQDTPEAVVDTFASSISAMDIESALSSHGDKMDNFGIIKYNDIPVLFAGRPLNGAGVIDKYSKIHSMRRT